MANASKTSSTLKAALRWSFAIAILAFLFHQHRGGFERLGQRQVIWGWIGIAFALRAGSLYISCFRWFKLMDAQRLPVQLSDALRLGFLGNLCNFLIPGTVGGDLTKVVMISREQKSKGAVAAATVVLDRIIGLMGLIVLGTVAGIAIDAQVDSAGLQIATVILAGGTLVGLGGLFAMLKSNITQLKLFAAIYKWRFVGGIVKQVADGVTHYQSQPGVVWKGFAISVVGHIANVGSYYCCMLALQLSDVAPSLLAHFWIIPVAETAAAVLPLPGGIGAREGAVQFLFGALAATAVLREAAPEAGFFTAISFSTVSVAVAAVCGLISLALKRADETPSVALNAAQA